MKIVHLVAPARSGGLERVIHALAIGQQRSGQEVLTVPVVQAWTEEHSFAAPLLRAGVPIRPIVVPHRAYLRERAELKKLLAATLPDVVHTHGYHVDVIGGGVARRAGCATVSTAHGFTRGPLRNRLYEALCRRVLRSFDAVVAVSKPLADELLASGMPADRICVVPNAWSQISKQLGRAEARAELGLEPGGSVIGWVGRMTREKGLDVMVDALSHLRDIPVTLCAIGDGPERQSESARADQLGVADRIVWAGLVREAGRLFNAFDTIVISSRTEGLPMVLLEAFASGVPLVTTAVGGIPDVASEREAWLIRAERPDEVAAAVRSVLVDPAQAEVRVRAARSRLEQEFSEGPWLEQYEKVYQAALRRSGGRGAQPRGPVR